LAGNDASADEGYEDSSTDSGSDEDAAATVGVEAEKEDAQPADEAAAKDINNEDINKEKDEEHATGNAGELITSRFRFQS